MEKVENIQNTTNLAPYNPKKIDMLCYSDPFDADNLTKKQLIF